MFKLFDRSSRGRRGRVCSKKPTWSSQVSSTCGWKLCRGTRSARCRRSGLPSSPSSRGSSACVRPVDSRIATSA
eukprot:6810172-Pyramimonas_sp.AAC.1